MFKAGADGSSRSRPRQKISGIVGSASYYEVECTVSEHAVWVPGLDEDPIRIGIPAGSADQAWRGAPDVDGSTRGHVCALRHITVEVDFILALLIELVAYFVRSCGAAGSSD
jgi:hypothetical protein